jgi:hypothetical protein
MNNHNLQDHVHGTVTFTLQKRKNNCKALKRSQKSKDEESFETKATDLVRIGGKRLGMIWKNLSVYENQKF